MNDFNGKQSHVKQTEEQEMCNRVKKRIKEFKGREKINLQTAYDMGKDLYHLKKMQRRNWTKYYNDNFVDDFSLRTAYKYINIFLNWDDVKDMASVAKAQAHFKKEDSEIVFGSASEILNNTISELGNTDEEVPKTKSKKEPKEKLYGLPYQKVASRKAFDKIQRNVSGMIAIICEDSVIADQFWEFVKAVKKDYDKAKK